MDQYDFDTQQGGDATQGAAAPFPPLVRPTPSYPHAYTTILGPGSNGSDGRSSQTAFYDQENLAFGPAIMSTWGDATTGPGPFDPQTGTNYDYVHAAERAIEVSSYSQQVQQYHLDDRASNVQPFPLAPRVSHIPGSTSSPNLFGNHQHLQHQVPGISFPPNNSQPSSTSASPASINSRHGYSLDSKPPVLSSTSAVAPFNSSPVSSASALKNEPADAPWNLVPYSLPFAAGRGNGVPGDASGSPAGTSPGGAPLFLRSPTPTKRQRTSQACEKCRDRKAKVSRPRWDVTLLPTLLPHRRFGTNLDPFFLTPSPTSALVTSFFLPLVQWSPSSLPTVLTARPPLRICEGATPSRSQSNWQRPPYGRRE